MEVESMSAGSQSGDDRAVREEVSFFPVSLVTIDIAVDPVAAATRNWRPANGPVLTLIDVGSGRSEGGGRG
jgi:hypothetical protein